MNIREELFILQDVLYADFQAKLTPGIPRELFIGVRVPEVRKLAKRLIKEKNPETVEFLNNLPHKYYDENMLHGLLLSEMKDYGECIAAVDRFLPYVDNWAVCDIMSPKVFRKNKATLLDKIKEWSASEKTYTCRFGLEMLMTHFLDDDFRTEYLEIPASVHSEEYYVKMMAAWFFATALAKQWDAAVQYIEERRLDTWVHNKTIQKACESYRITPEQKTYLKTLKQK
ncbi:MAG: DNA alkylation repair protein [Lachnospiraceae bacterium]|nr:DNA alkylation repair protein [Lachnospiraceae bacterium]